MNKQYDAWKISPPCERDPYQCNRHCPYFHNDCWVEDEEDDQ